MYIRCDDIFVDTDPDTCRAIWNLIRKYGFNQILGVVPRGYGNTILHRKPARQGNKWIKEHTGKIWFGKNRRLVRMVKDGLTKGDSLGMHGYYHVAFGREEPRVQRWHMKSGIRYLKDLFGTKPEYFIPPFNNLNNDTWKLCKRLGMKVTVSPGYEMDVFLTNKNYNKADIRRRARMDFYSKYYPFYHPFWFEGKWKEDTVYIERHKKYLKVRGTTWDLDWALGRLKTYLEELQAIEVQDIDD